MKDVEVYGKIIEMFIRKMTSPEVGQLRLEVSTFKLILERSRIDEPSLVKFTLTDDGKVVNNLSDSENSIRSLSSLLARSLDFIHSLIGEDAARDVIISSMLEELDDISEELKGRQELVRSFPEPFSTLLEEDPEGESGEMRHGEVIDLFQEVFLAYLKDLSNHTDLSAFKLKLSILREKNDLIKSVDLNRNNNLVIGKEAWSSASKDEVKQALISMFDSMVGLSTFLLGKEEALKKANRIFHYYFAGREDILKDYDMKEDILEGSFRWKLTTGIDELDRKMKGGIPSGASILLISPSGIERDLFISGILKKGLIQGCSALMVISKEPPRSVRMLLRSNGLDPDDLEEEGRLRMVDWFSWRGERIIGVERDGHALKSSKILSNLSIAINKGLRELEFSSTKLGIIHIIGPATNIFEFNQVYNFVQRLRAKFKDEGMASIFVLEKESLSREMESRLTEMFDGHIQIDKSMEAGRFNRQMTIGSLSGVDFDASPMDFRITDNSIVAEGVATEELPKVRKPEERVPEELEVLPQADGPRELEVLPELEDAAEKKVVRPTVVRRIVRRKMAEGPKVLRRLVKTPSPVKQNPPERKEVVKPVVRRKLKRSQPSDIDEFDMEGIDLGFGGGPGEEVLLETLDSLEMDLNIRNDGRNKKLK